MERKVNFWRCINRRSWKSSSARSSLIRGSFSSERTRPRLQCKAQSSTCDRWSSEIIIQGPAQMEVGRCPGKTASGMWHCLHTRARVSGISWVHRAARAGASHHRCVMRLGQNARPHKQPPSVDCSRRSDSSSASAAINDNLQHFQIQLPPSG